MKDYPNVIVVKGEDPGVFISDKFVFEIKLEKKVYTTSKLLVYYDNDGEIISDVIDLEIHTCSPNKVGDIQVFQQRLVLCSYVYL